MEIVLCIVTFLLGGTIGYIAGRVAEEIRQEKMTAEHVPLEAPKMMKQYQNFLNYDGTGKGQEHIED